MKQIILTLMCILLVGCTTQEAPEEKQPEIVYIAAQYCVDDECNERQKVKIDMNQLDTIAAYIDQLPKVYTSNLGQIESAKLVMIDENGYQYVISETVEIGPGRKDYMLNYQGNRLSWMIDEDHRFTEFLKGLEGEALSNDEAIGYEMPEPFYIVSLYDVSNFNKPDGSLSYELSGYDLLFYINESFNDVTQIKNQNLLLAGLLSKLNHPYSSAQTYNNQLLIADGVYDYAEIESIGNDLIKNYQLPELQTSQFAVLNNEKYYYDSDKRQFYVENNDHNTGEYIDMVLMPLYSDGNITRIARFLVKKSYINRYEYYEIILNDNTYSQRVTTKEKLYNQMVMHLDQVDLFDVETEYRDKLKSVEVIQLVETVNEPITADSFLYEENDEMSVYVLQEDSIDAMLYNKFIEDEMYASTIQSSLNETEALIEIVVVDSAKDESISIFFDKASGRMMHDGMINELLYNGEMKNSVIEQVKKQVPTVCPLSYKDSLSVERCYVEPMIDTATTSFLMNVPLSQYYLNEKQQLVVPVIIKSYGGYLETIEIKP